MNRGVTYSFRCTLMALKCATATPHALPHLTLACGLALQCNTTDPRRLERNCTSSGIARGVCQNYQVSLPLFVDTWIARQSESSLSDAGVDENTFISAFPHILQKRTSREAAFLQIFGGLRYRIPDSAPSTLDPNALCPQHSTLNPIYAACRPTSDIDAEGPACRVSAAAQVAAGCCAHAALFAACPCELLLQSASLH